jgi:hypothetical protein
MPWFKVDDTLALHHKTVAAGNSAMGLWVRAGSWSMQTLSDGFVPDVIVTALGSHAQARKLVDVGLWDRMPSGYAFHEWAERQPTKTDVEQERADNARRQKEWREKRRKERGGDA